MRHAHKPALNFFPVYYIADNTKFISANPITKVVAVKSFPND